MKLRWEDSFEARESKNVRGEDVYDIYRKGTEDMIYSDIPKNSLEDIKKQMVTIVEVVAAQEIEELLGQETTTKDVSPMSVEYNRLRSFGGSAFFEEEKKDETT